MSLLERVRIKTLQEAAQEIRNEEGLRLKAYRNSPDEPWTIGYGFTYWPSGVKVQEHDTITKDVAERILASQVQQRMVEVLSCIIDSIEPKLTANMMTALISLHHNIGPTFFRGSSVVRCINQGLFHEAADAFLMWHRGNEENDLLPRRKRERRLFLTPDTPTA